MSFGIYHLHKMIWIFNVLSHLILLELQAPSGNIHVR